MELITELAKNCSNDLQDIILDALQSTSESNRISRNYLVDILHISDRAVRKEIEAMRNSGIPIASSDDAKGYYLPSSYEEYVKFATRYLSRAYTVITTQGRMQDMAQKIFGGQIEMDITNG